MPTTATTLHSAHPLDFSQPDHRLQPLTQPGLNRDQPQTFAEPEAARAPGSQAIHIPPLQAAVSRPVAASPAFPLAPQPRRAIDPIDPVSSLDGRFGGRMPQRSRLSPAQRATQLAAQRATQLAAQRETQLATQRAAQRTARHRRSEPVCEGRSAYVTYTIPPR